MKLIKEIKDRNGKLYFRRYRILTLPFVYLEMHEFFQDEYDDIFDKDGHLHNHPNEFFTLIAKGGYVEFRKDDITSDSKMVFRKPISLAFIDHKCFHRVHTLFENYCKTYTLKFKKTQPWGYLVDGKFVGHEDYRAKKNPQDPK